MSGKHQGFYQCVLGWVICIEALVCVGWWEMAIAVCAVPGVLFVAAYAIGVVCLAGATRRHDGPCRKSEGDT